MPVNVFVLGLDEPNRQELGALPDASDYRFHPLLTSQELLAGDIELADLLAKAEAELDAFDGDIDAIVGYWDFPVSSMVTILCRRRGLPSASLEAVLKCEHKYWSRVEQQKVIEEHPGFALVKLDDRAPPPGVGFPMWLKPVKGFSSELAFRVDDAGEFRDSLAEIRQGIARVGEPFEFALSQVELPQEIYSIGGQVCLAEEAVSGRQVTVEGYNDGETIRVYGIIDSHNYQGTSSFLRYQYPSELPERVKNRLVEVSERVIAGVDLRSVFNIEYFWDPESDAINLLEINPRQSQSHAMLFDLVDGVPHHQCMLRLALGRDPELPSRQGQYPLAAKWFYRRFRDGFVRRGPTAEEVARIGRDIPGTSVDIEAHQGVRLSELAEQDSYSYNLAVVHIGANDSAELQDKYERCVGALPFEFDE